MNRMGLLGIAISLASCGDGPAGNGPEAAANDPIVQNESASVAGNEAVGEPIGNSAIVNGSADVAVADGGSCRRVEASEARKFTGLELAGTSGNYRFYGRGSELLCSEPGANGRGECEIPGAAQVRVEGPTGTYGFKNPANSPAILSYSPEGVTCRAR